MKKILKALSFVLTLTLMLSFAALAADTAPSGPAAGGSGGPGGAAGAGGSKASAGAASTADLTDYAAVQNKDAVSAMVAFGIINGIAQEDGSYKFDPKAGITREAMAKMVAVAVTLASGESASAEKSAFDDVAGRWSEDYVNFCAEKGIISGRGAGVFDYAGSITVAETAKLLLAALGDKTLTGASWKADTLKAAGEKSLLAGVTGDPDDSITRDEAALVIYNALMGSDGSAALPQVIYLSETKHYDELAIGENTYVAAAEGKTVNLLVDKVQQNIEPGTYHNATLYVTENLTGVYASHGSEKTQVMSAALYVDETGVVSAKSVVEALNGVTYDNAGAAGGSVVSKGDKFGAVRVGGKGVYTVTGMSVSLEGVGGNDFTGMGSAFAVCDEGKLTVNSATVTTNGILRTAAFCGNSGTLTVNDSTFTCDDGGYTAATAPTVPDAGMTTPPKALGVLGYCRATCMVDSGTSYYNNSTISSDMWGALATDDVDGAKMYVDNCVIETKTNGYGAYSIGPCEEYFKNSTFNVASMGVICAAEGHCELDNTVINSQRYGVVTHQPFGLISRIYLKNGSVINAKYCGIQVKSRGSDIQIDNSKINVEEGPMIQAQYNDDTGAGDIYGAFQVSVQVTNSTLTGDIVQSQPGKDEDSVMTVLLGASTLNGAITTAVQNNNVTDGKFDESNNYLVGRLTNTYAPLEKSALNLTLEKGAVWNVSAASYLTGLKIGEGCTVNGDIYVNYVKTEGPGDYTGGIIVLPKGSAAPAPAA